MIIDSKAANDRLQSPMNLMNRLKDLSNNGNKRKNAMSLFIRPKIKENKTSFNPFAAAPRIEEKSSEQSTEPLALIPPPATSTTLDTILENHDSQIKLGLAHDKALELLNRSTEMLSNKLDEIRADRLPSVVAAASKVVEGIRKERSEASKNNKDREVHYHFYTPEQKSIDSYEVIDVTA